MGDVRCPFRFKDAACGYSGPATSCDKTFACCRALGNEVRFPMTVGLPRRPPEAEDGLTVEVSNGPPAWECPHGQPWHECLQEPCEALHAFVWKRVINRKLRLDALAVIGCLVVRGGMGCVRHGAANGSGCAVELTHENRRVKGIVVHGGTPEGKMMIWAASYPCVDECGCYVYGVT